MGDTKDDYQAMPQKATLVHYQKKGDEGREGMYTGHCINDKAFINRVPKGIN